MQTIWTLGLGMSAVEEQYRRTVFNIVARNHQMSVAGKRDGFERANLDRFAESSGLRKTGARRIVDEVVAAVASWPKFGADAGEDEAVVRQDGHAHRVWLR